MCQYLDWGLNVEPSTLREFEDMVRKDFAGPGPYVPNIPPADYPNWPRRRPTPSPPSLQTQVQALFHPSALARRPRRNPHRRPLSYPPTQQVHTSRPPPHPSSVIPTPASSASPPTPTGMIDNNVKIMSHDISRFVIANQAALDSTTRHSSATPLAICVSSSGVFPGQSTFIVVHSPAQTCTLPHFPRQQSKRQQHDDTPSRFQSAWRCMTSSALAGNLCMVRAWVTSVCDSVVRGCTVIL